MLTAALGLGFDKKKKRLGHLQQREDLMLKEFTDGRCIVDLTDFIAVANMLQCVTIANIQEMVRIHKLFQAKTDRDQGHASTIIFVWVKEAVITCIQSKVTVCALVYIHIYTQNCYTHKKVCDDRTRHRGMWWKAHSKNNCTWLFQCFQHTCTTTLTVFGKLIFMFFKGVSYAQQVCIYSIKIKIKVKTVNIVKYYYN